MCQWPSDLCFLQLKQIWDAATKENCDICSVINNNCELLCSTLSHISASWLPTRLLCLKSVINLLPFAFTIIPWVSCGFMKHRLYWPAVSYLTWLRIDLDNLIKPSYWSSIKQTVIVFIIVFVSCRDHQWIRVCEEEAEHPVNGHSCFSAVWSLQFMHIYFEGEIIVGFFLLH